MSNNRKWNPSPNTTKTTLRQTTAHHNRVPSPQNFWPPSQQTSYRLAHPGGCKPACRSACEPASLPSTQSSTLPSTQNPTLFHVSFLPPPTRARRCGQAGGPPSPKTEVPCALTPFQIRTLTFKRLLTMVACGAEIIVIVPLAVGPPSDEGLVSWQGTPMTGLGGGEGRYFFFLLTSLLVEKW